MDITKNALGAGGATAKHLHPPISPAGQQLVRKKIKTKKYSSTRWAMKAVNIEQVKNGKRPIKSNQTIHNITHGDYCHPLSLSSSLW